MIGRISVYISESHDVYKNLAIEKCIFDRVQENEIILYLWQNENTVVIGRNQNAYAECNTSFAKEENISVARRLSGGGAVFHDMGNLNFTFISYKDNLSTEKNMKIIADACNMAGIKTQVSGRNDLLCDGRKFSGNAFYNSAEKAYHHGTIMVNCDLEKMQKVLTPPLEKLISNGVKSVRSRVMNLCEVCPLLDCGKMKEFLICAFEKAYDSECGYFDDIDMENVTSVATQYAKHEYVFGKSFAFSFSVKGRFDWGSIEIMPEIKDGCINSVAVFTDSLVWQMADTVENCLVSCEFSRDSVSEKLAAVLEENQKNDILQLLFGIN